MSISTDWDAIDCVYANGHWLQRYLNLVVETLRLMQQQLDEPTAHLLQLFLTHGRLVPSNLLEPVVRECRTLTEANVFDPDECRTRCAIGLISTDENDNLIEALEWVQFFVQRSNPELTRAFCDLVREHFPT